MLSPATYKLPIRNATITVDIGLLPARKAITIPENPYPAAIVKVRRNSVAAAITKPADPAKPPDARAELAVIADTGKPTARAIRGFTPTNFELIPNLLRSTIHQTNISASPAITMP